MTGAAAIRSNGLQKEHKPLKLHVISGSKTSPRAEIAVLYYGGDLIGFVLPTTVPKATSLKTVLKDLGRGIRQSRSSRGLTQERAASLAGIDYKRYQRIEAGTVNLTVRTLHRIARALDVDFWQLLRKA
jgi:DNA-binding XRE family transcriptional regulator